MNSDQPTQEVALRGEQLPAIDAPPATLFGTSSPALIVERVSEMADALAGFIRKHHMARRLETDAAARRREERGLPAPKEYVFVEGWAFAGQMLGIAPLTREVREVRNPAGHLVGFEAVVELVRADGTVIGAAIGECSWDEERWQGRDAYALKSMAQTRAMGSAFRRSLGFIMTAAGFEATPAEEMPSDGDEDGQGRQRRASRSQAGRSGARSAARSESAPSASEDKRNGVARVDRPNSVRELYQASRYFLGYQPAQVASALEVSTTAMVAELAMEHYDGDFTHMLADVLQQAKERDGIETDWQAPEEPAAEPEPEAVAP